MKTKSTLRSFLCLAGTSLLTITYTSATTYYWDSDDSTAGFGGVAAIWTAPTNGTLTSGWSTDSTGSTTIDGNSVTTLTTDDVFFGTNTTPFTGTITFSGALSVGSMYACSTHGNFSVPVADPGTHIITFANDGIFESARDATLTMPAVGFAGAANSLTIRAVRTLNLRDITNSIPASSKVVLETSPDSLLSLPGRVGITTANAVAATGSITYNTPLDGDTVTVNGVVLTKAAVAGAAEFTSITELNALVDAIPGVDSTEDGTVVSITAATPGQAGNAITLAETGAMAVSGAKLTGGVSSQLGVGTDLEFNGATLRFITNLSYASLSDLDTAHPVTFVLNKDAGFDNQVNSTTFTVDQSVNLGSGKFITEGSTSGLIKLTQPNTWAELRLVAGTCEIDNLNQLGSAVRWGSSGASGGNGTLKILGPITSFGALPMLTSSGKGVSINIDDVANTFTVDQQLAMGTGGFSKTGAGALNLNHASASNAYSGLTTVSAGTLNVSNIPAAVSGLTSVTGGTLNLSGDNSASIGGVTMNNAAAILNLDSTSALGTGTCTLQNGTLKNSVTTLSTTHPVALAGNFTWDGVNNLTFGSGAITMAAGRTITLNGTGSVLTFGGLLTNTQAGNPTLTANGAGNTLVITGGFDLSNSSTSRTATISGTGNVTISAAVANGSTATASGLTKTGTGTLTLNGDNTYGGLTTHSTAGSTLTLAGDNSGAAGGLTMNNATAVTNVNHAGALGTGTLTLTTGIIDNTSGSAKILTTNNVVNIGGNFTFGGSNNLTFGNGSVSNNGSRTFTLNGTGSTLAFGGQHINTLANNQTTTVNGAGNTLSVGGWALSNTVTARIGTITGSGNVTINGAVIGSSLGGSEAIASSLTYSGTGTLTLNGGTNIYTGNTLVNSTGCLALVGGSQESAITVNSGAFLGFTLGSPTTSTKAVTLSTGHLVRITGTPTVGVDYTLLTTSATIGGDTPALETPLGTHTLEVQGTNTLVLKANVVSTPFGDWAATGTLGPVTFDGDTNGDGVKDGLAFLLGVTNPDNDANGALPIVTEDGLGGLVLTFSCLNDASNGAATLNVEHSSDLGISDLWTAVAVPEVTTAPSSNVGFVVTGGSPLNSVVATIDSGAAASGKVFGRLRGEKP